MKQKFLTSFIVFVAGAIVFSGCKKKEDGLISPTAIMSARVNEASWEALGHNIQASNKYGLIQISGLSTTNNYKYIDLWVSGSTMGSYVLSKASGNKGMYTDQLIGEYDSHYASTPGSFVITQMDTIKKIMSGTFKFTGIRGLTTDSVVVSGNFINLSYQTP